MNRLRIAFYSMLALLLAGAIYFHFNAAEVYAYVGNYYFKHNHVAKAQKYYEKAFILGNRDEELREVYVNSIINSPLTVENQEKLVKIAEGEVTDAASVSAKYFLYDLKREIHRKYPLNYIKQAPYNQRIVRWSKLPISYAYKNRDAVPQEFVREIDAAFSEWEHQGVVLFAETNNNDANIQIEFLPPKQEKVELGEKYVIAYTSPIIAADELKSMEIKFYTQSPDGTPFSSTQIYNTALHEIFHALGFMGHSYDKNNIMYLTKDAASEGGDTELTDADKMTLELLYKIKPDITNKGDLVGDYVPYLVLGDDEEVSFSKEKEARNYIQHAPELAGGYIDLAESYVAQKKYPEAIRVLEKALQLVDNKDAKYIVCYNLAVSYYYINHFELAEDYLARAAEIKQSEELHFLRAEIKLHQNDYDAAIAEYRYLVRVSPDNINYAVYLANIYLKKHDYIRARAVLKNFLKNNPNEKNNEKLAPYKMLLF